MKPTEPTSTSPDPTPESQRFGTPGGTTYGLLSTGASSTANPSAASQPPTKSSLTADQTTLACPTAPKPSADGLSIADTSTSSSATTTPQSTPTDSSEKYYTLPGLSMAGIAIQMFAREGRDMSCPAVLWRLSPTEAARLTGPRIASSLNASEIE